MRAKIGEVIKNIPIEYWEAAMVIDESFITEPERIRLSNSERFLLAELSWRMKQADRVFEYLKDMTPIGVEIQINRAGEARCAVNYTSGIIKAQAIVPLTFRRVGAPVSYNNVNWIKS